MAFRTVPVAATVVTIACGPAVLTGFFVTAQSGSAAGSDFSQNFCLQRGKLCFSCQTGVKPVKHISQLKLCPHSWGSYKAYRADCAVLSAGIVPHEGKSWLW